MIRLTVWRKDYHCSVLCLQEQFSKEAECFKIQALENRGGGGQEVQLFTMIVL